MVIALYREARVVQQLLAAIDALAYPRAKLDVKLVLEQDDHETFEALQHLGMPPFCEVIVAPRGAPQTKPRALNVRLPLFRGKLVAVYDAEDIPDPQQLRLAASRPRVSLRRRRASPAFRRSLQSTISVTVGCRRFSPSNMPHSLT